MAVIAAPTDLPAPQHDDAPVGRLRRFVLYAFLLAVVACGVFQIEAWPLSGFRLFSQTRSGTEIRWELVIMDATGAERPVDLSEMRRGFRHTEHLLPDLATDRARERPAACTAWFGELPDAARLRVYRSVYRRPSPSSRSATLTRRALRFECVRR